MRMQMVVGGALVAALALTTGGGCDNSNGEGQHFDGFGNHWVDDQPEGTRTAQQAQLACQTYRQALAHNWAGGGDASVEDQNPEHARDFLCEPVQNESGTVTKVCTLLELQEAPSLDIISRRICWNLDGTITINSQPYSGHWK